MHPARRLLRVNRKPIVLVVATAMATIGFRQSRRDETTFGSFRVYKANGILSLAPCACDDSSESSVHPQAGGTPRPFLSKEVIPSWHRRLLATIGIVSLPLPRTLTPGDLAFRISKSFLRKRRNDEERMRKLVMETAPKLQGDPQFEKKMARLRHEIFELAYGKGVTPQLREDFLIKYGCTGFTDRVLSRILEVCAARGIVEVGAGHGQWQKALTDAYNNDTTRGTKDDKKTFDFCLAYDNHSNLPLSPHIYNQYTKPHHDHFGTVRLLESSADLERVFRSWTCRGRALLMVYPPPGSMAIETLHLYLQSSPQNDTLIYIGEGRGGANGDEAFFDVLENGEWILEDVLEVTRPPGDKGCEKLYILQRKEGNA